MTPVTRNLVYQDGGALVVNLDYDDTTLRILSIHVENNSAQDYIVSATATATGRNYTLTIPPGIIDQPVPQNTVDRLQLSVTPSGKLDGVQWSIQ